MLTETFTDFRPIRIDRRQPISNQIFDHLRAQIVSLQLAPGTLLSRQVLAETFGVSQTPIREALLRLEQEALVTVHPQSSTTVAPIDLAHAHEAQFLRISLECEVSRTIALDPAAYDLATPTRLLEDMHRAWDDGQDKPSFVRSDLDYHRALFRTTGHEGLWEIVKQRSGNVDRLRNLHLPEPGKAAQILADHHAHLDALKAGDEVEAQRVVRRHLTGTLGKAHELRELHRQFFF
jgi:GntR family transcriptional regulator, rspAB operon transcriptional repressor